MTLKLTQDTLAEITRLQDALLSPNIVANTSRVEAILVAIRRLIGAQRSFAFYQDGARPAFIADGVGPQIMAYVERVFIGVDRDGNYLMTDKALQDINQRRRQMGAGVHHEARLQNRALIEEAAYFREAFVPAGMVHVIGMSTPLPVGEAVFAFGFASAEDKGFTGERSVQLLSLLLPAFKAGFARFGAACEPGLQPPPRSDGPAPAALTKRQYQVARMIVAGMTDPQIAQELGISRNTVRRHSEAILSRLGLHSRSGLAARLGSAAKK